MTWFRSGRLCAQAPHDGADQVVERGQVLGPDRTPDPEVVEELWRQPVLLPSGAQPRVGGVHRDPQAERDVALEPSVVL